MESSLVIGVLIIEEDVVSDEGNSLHFMVPAEVFPDRLIGVGHHELLDILLLVERSHRTLHGGR